MLISMGRWRGAGQDEDDEFGDHNNGQHQFSKPPPVVVTTTTSQGGGVPGLDGAGSAALHYVREGGRSDGRRCSTST